MVILLLLSFQITEYIFEHRESDAPRKPFLITVKKHNGGNNHEQIQERTERLQSTEKEIRSAVETGHQHRDRHTLQSRNYDRGKPNLHY